MWKRRGLLITPEGYADCLVSESGHQIIVKAPNKMELKALIKRILACLAAMSLL